jgi:hypothetical protein
MVLVIVGVGCAGDTSDPPDDAGADPDATVSVDDDAGSSAPNPQEGVEWRCRCQGEANIGSAEYRYCAGREETARRLALSASSANKVCTCCYLGVCPVRVDEFCATTGDAVLCPGETAMACGISR